MRTVLMSTHQRRNRRGWISAALLALILGATPVAIAGANQQSPAPSPEAAKKDEESVRAADHFLDALAKKDGAALASLCGSPFLWGRLDRGSVLKGRAEIKRCLSEELLQGWAPSMYSPQRSLNAPLLPAAFFAQYANHLGALPQLKKRLEAFRLEQSDRVVVDESRGMLIAIRGSVDGVRIVAVALGGFRPPSFQLTRDVIYGRKFGMALTLDVIQPKRGGNRAAVLHVISDTFYSNPPTIGSGLHARQQGLIDRGYTIVFVTHSSVPRYPITEIVGDVRRAVRYIRFHAARFDLDPNRIAVMGASSAGYLALTTGASDRQATPFPPTYDPVRTAEPQSDPVESVSSKATAIVAYFPVTDWLNYGATGKTIFDFSSFPYTGILDLYDYDAKRVGFKRISDRAEQLRRLQASSPMSCVERGFSPTLLFHGGKDTHIPVQQSESMAGALNAAGADVELVVKPNEEHGWSDNAADQNKLVEWLDQRLLGKGK